MPEPTAMRRRLGRGLIWGAALALPLTATIGYAAPDMPPAPPAPPVPAAAPADPAAPHVEKRVVIIRHAGAHGDPARMKTRSITRDGKTVTFSTDEDMSDAQIDARMAEIEAHHGAVVITDTAVPATPDTPGTPHREVRRIVINSADGKHSDHDIMAMAMADGAMTCSDKDGPAMVETNSVGTDSARKIVRVKLCQTAHAKGAAINGLRHARDRIANDKSMSDKIRDEVVRSLDEEIARMSKAG